MNRSGFTFIELLVSVAIMLALTGGVIVNYNTFNDQQKARQAALNIKNNLRLFQSHATNGEKPASDCTSLVGYEVRFAVNSYTVQTRCNPQGLIAGSDQTYLLGSGITFSPPPSTVVFKVLSRGIDTDTTINVVGQSRSYQFQVKRSGDMSDVTQAP